MKLNLLDFGAIGDGITMNTRAFQSALDTLEQSGGGELVVPAGIYLSGAIRLIRNLNLHLEQGAVIKASPNSKDHLIDDKVNPNWLNCYFIYGYDLNNVNITGSGTIDGNGRAFWSNVYSSGHTDETLPPARSIIEYNVYKPLTPRPVVLYLVGCEDIKLHGITIVNASAYTVWIIDSIRVLIDGVTIRNPRNGPNTDALDLECSQQVRIVNCDIEAGDDCIALKSDPNRLGRFRESSDIIVSNCILSSATCAIRIGYEGDAPIRNCVFSNLTIRDSRHGIDILSITPVCSLKIEHGTPIENIIFSNIIMHRTGQSFFIWAGNESPRNDYSGHIKNLQFSNIIADSVATSYIGSKDQVAIFNLSFRDIILHVSDPPEIQETVNADSEVPSHWGGHCKCGGLRLNKVSGVHLSNVKITCDHKNFPPLILTEVDKVDGKINVQLS